MQSKCNIFAFIGWLAGGERRTIEISTCLSKLGYELDLILPYYAYRELKNDGRLLNSFLICHVINAPPPREGGRLINLLMYSTHIFKGLLFANRVRKSFSLIYCPSNLLEILTVALVTKRKNPTAKLVVLTHHLAPKPKERMQYKELSLLEGFINILGYLFQRITIFLMNKYADVILTLTSYTKQKLIEEGAYFDKIKLTSNGVDIAHFARIHVENKRYDACMIGIDPRKGTFDLIKGWRKVCKHVKGARLVIVGALGKWRKHLLECIDLLGLQNNVVVTGYISDDEKIKVLKSCKVFVCPSYEEGWALTISEAMACELPVVAYENPVFREVYGSTILYAQRGDIDAIAKTIVAILSNPKLAKDYSSGSIKWAVRHSWRKVAEKEDMIIAELLSS